jgi:outer membrane protease
MSRKPRGITAEKLPNRIILAATLLCALAGKVEAQATDVLSVSLSATGGILAGSANEYVFQNGKTLSELVWPLEITPSFGLEFSALAWEHIEFAGTITAGLPGDSGTMTDSDYLNLPASAAKTHYSEHEASLDSAIDLGARIGWRFRLPDSRASKASYPWITPSIGIRWMKYKWTGSNGWTQYGAKNADGTYTEWNSGLTKQSLSGIVITYSQEYLIPTLGATLFVPATDRFSVTLAVAYAPYLWCNAVDHHMKVSPITVYYDITKGGWFFEPDLSVSFRASGNISLFAGARWTKTGIIHGDTYKQEEPSSTYTVYREAGGNGGGAALGLFSARLGVSVTAGLPGKAPAGAAP